MSASKPIGFYKKTPLKLGKMENFLNSGKHQFLSSDTDQNSGYPPPVSATLSVGY